MQQVISSYTLGADPEFFVFNTGENRIISSDGIIPGEKGMPYTKGLAEGFGIEVDNILGEYNIPPCNNKDEWVNNHTFMLSWIRDFLAKINPCLSIKHASSAHIDEDQLQSDVAREFGCSADYNVYTEDINPKPNGANTNLRSTGCHIHLGYENCNIATSFKLIKYLDMYLGIPSILYDQDTERRTLYGKAGCFRLTSYGLEYRTLSGIWISSTEKIAWMYDQVEKAVKAYNAKLPLISPEEVQRTINTSDVKNARKLCKEFNLI